MDIRIKEAKNRRQMEVVNPDLFQCSLTGNANRLYCILESGDNVNPTVSEKKYENDKDE